MLTTLIAVVAGDDYKNADARALTFTDATWPSITGGTVALKIGTASIAGTVVSATSCRFDLTKTQTAAITAGSYTVVATLSDASVVTLAAGPLRVTG